MLKRYADTPAENFLSTNSQVKTYPELYQPARSPKVREMLRQRNELLGAMVIKFVYLQHVSNLQLLEGQWFVSHSHLPDERGYMTPPRLTKACC